MEKLLIVAAIVFLLNIPFGYWRANVRKFSVQWMLAIHIPVIIIIAIRLATHLGFAWYTYVFLVTMFFLGQRLGGYIMQIFQDLFDSVTSCLIIDLYKHYRR